MFDQILDKVRRPGSTMYSSAGSGKFKKIKHITKILKFRGFQDNVSIVIRSYSLNLFCVLLVCVCFVCSFLHFVEWFSCVFVLYVLLAFCIVFRFFVMFVVAFLLHSKIKTRPENTMYSSSGSALLLCTCSLAFFSFSQALQPLYSTLPGPLKLIGWSGESLQGLSALASPTLLPEVVEGLCSLCPPCWYPQNALKRPSQTI